MIVITNSGQEVELTSEEVKYFKAVQKLEKMNPGRLVLFGSGRMDVRLDGDGFTGWSKDSFAILDIRCEGGDGGD